MLDFKVCLKDIDHHIEDEVKRFELGEDECNLMGVLTKIEQTFPILLQHEYYISWVDQVILPLLEIFIENNLQEGDRVTISEDADLCKTFKYIFWLN